MAAPAAPRPSFLRLAAAATFVLALGACSRPEPPPEPCRRACGADACGDDGCGGTCGPCAGDQACVGGRCVTEACTPSCAPGACGDDGCGGACAPCASGTSCDAGVCVPECVPSCAPGSCASDGCGGTCGPCASGESCDGGVCVTACVPACDPGRCGPDGCGGTCGGCDAGTICEAGACVAVTCTPTCAPASCGPDGCGGTCGPCAMGTACDGGLCTAVGCSPACAPGSCGPDGCGGTCGPCAVGQRCTNGQCAACVPSCAPGSCGPDGCGGTCGSCAAGTTCADGGCVCTPRCGANVCGSDGCGGSCGTCASGTTCQAGRCVSGCVPSWNPTWSYGPHPGDAWVELVVQGGGIRTEAVWVELVGASTSTPLSYAFGRWAGGVPGLARGRNIIVHARDALGATTQTRPFRHLTDLSPQTDPCRSTPRTSSRCQPLARGMVTFTIDDSGGSQASIAVPLLRRHDVKATFYHVPNFLTWTSLARALAAEGHEAAAHTMTHRTLTQLSAREVDDELRLSKQWLETNVSAPVDSFASPSGAYNAAVLSAVRPRFRSHRTTLPGLNFTGSDVYELHTDFVLGQSSAASVCAQMQQAAAVRGWLVLTFHDFTNASSSARDFTVSATLFEALLTCAKNTPGLDVVTTRQGVEAIRCPP